MTPLWAAASAGNLYIVYSLLEYGAKVNTQVGMWLGGEFMFGCKGCMSAIVVCVVLLGDTCLHSLRECLLE